ncbi:MAG: ribonuclease Z [Bacteroidota bacterium]
MFGVTILGNNSAIPSHDRHPTAQVVTIEDQILLLDCGEGTQMQFNKYKVRRSKITYIFISHLHGDHYFGLIGLITSMALLNRVDDLHIYGPKNLQQIIEIQLEAAGVILPFKLSIHAITETKMIVDEKKFTVHCFPALHKIECWGFLIKEKKNPRKIDLEKTVAAEIPKSYYEELKKGHDYITKDGTTILNESVTIPNVTPKSYAFCADTRYDESIIEHIKDVTLLYHETTYLKDQPEKAFERFHSTTEQAATIALKANAGNLIIGHFSSRYDTLTSFLNEAKVIFPNTKLAKEGTTFTI